MDTIRPPFPSASNYITVSKGGEGDFNCLKDAMDAIGTNQRFPASSSSNRYCIVVFPSANGGTTDYQELNPIQGKSYTSVFSMGFHETVRFTCLNDDHGLICAMDSEYIGMNIRRAAPSAAGKAAYRIDGGIVDVDIHDCKGSNFDHIIWNRSIKENQCQVRQFNVTSGTCTNVIFCDNDGGGNYGGLEVIDLSVGPGATCTNVLKADGYASATLYALILARAVTIHGALVTNGISVVSNGRITFEGGVYDCAVGALLAAGTIYVGGTTFFRACASSVKITDVSGFFQGRCLFINSDTWDLETTAGGQISVNSQQITFSKLSFAAGTRFTCNEKTLSDQFYTNQNSNFMALGTYQEVLPAGTAFNPATPSHTNPMNMRVVVVFAAGGFVAGTLRLTGTSYNPITGATTGGDIEDIVVGVAGAYKSTKFWSLGVSVVLSSVGGLDGTITTYRDMPFDNLGKGFMLKAFKFELYCTASDTVTMYISKYTPVTGYTNLYTESVVTVNGIYAAAHRKELLDIFKTVTNDEALYIWFNSGGTNLRRFKYRIDIESE
jgi:hypothetical protein